MSWCLGVCLLDKLDQAWAQHYIAVGSRTFADDDNARCVASINNLTSSSCFTGIAGAEHASLVLAACLQAGGAGGAGTTVRPSTHTFSCEKSAGSQYEIQMTPGLENSCVFDDIVSFIKSTFYKDIIDTLEYVTYDDLVEMTVKRAAKLLGKYAWCVRRKRFCQIIPSFWHCAGTMCIDWSSLGVRLGTDGPSVLSYLVWICLCKVCGFKAILHENVDSFPTTALAHLEDE